MLNGLLDKKTCAACKICCGFDNTDLWEMPVMLKKSAERLTALKPETKFIEKDGGYVVNAGELKDDELFYCPALDFEKGCILGDDKPFDCLIWPFRIMETDCKSFRMITVSPVCPEIYNRPISELSEFSENVLKSTIYEYAKAHPEVVKPYESGYPILSFERIK